MHFQASAQQEKVNHRSRLAVVIPLYGRHKSIRHFSMKTVRYYNSQWNLWLGLAFQATAMDMSGRLPHLMGFLRLQI